MDVRLWLSGKLLPFPNVDELKLRDQNYKLNLPKELSAIRTALGIIINILLVVAIAVGKEISTESATVQKISKFHFYKLGSIYTRTTFQSDTISNVDTASFILVRTSGADKIQVVGAIAQLDFEPFGCRVYNGSVSQFLQGLKASYLKDSRLTLIDGTGYTGQIDLLLDTPLNTIEELNKTLAPYDLRFISKELPRVKSTPKEN
ncbi:hypothetical protein [Desertivirga xinjiangensis]|uniref:hypothetical protein n=1 Tax=Desertivirga xinjiangensis TaxID=539206 RepID=UPI00210F1381|nr:hypothetical protein [Pedobacter xinjiangensis]